MSNLNDNRNTPFNPETIEELTGYTVRDIVSMYEDYERAMAQNEALKKIVKKIDIDCDYCWYKGKEPSGCDFECMECKLKCGCSECRDMSNWAWKDEVDMKYPQNEATHAES